MMIRLLGSVAALFVLSAGTAAAHVTAHVPDSPPERGGHGTVILRVPNEEGHRTTRVEVGISPTYGITTARTRPVLGWDASVLRGPGGIVTSVVWTARPGYGVPGGDEHYEDFGLMLGPLPVDAEHVVLPTTQFLAEGSTVAWDGRPNRPAPFVALAEPSLHGNHGVRVASTSGVPWVAVITLGATVLLAIASVVLFRRREIV